MSSGPHDVKRGMGDEDKLLEALREKHPNVSRAAPDQIIRTVSGSLVIFGGCIYDMDDIAGEGEV
jgi:hypothetical protein